MDTYSMKAKCTNCKESWIVEIPKRKPTEIYERELECKYCGNILPYFPGKGKTIECNKCNYEQIIWI